jgi:hypothetical protein
MQKCASLKECQLKKDNCQHTIKQTSDVAIKKFVSHGNKCNIQVAYLTKAGQRSVHFVFYKSLPKLDCHIFHSKYLESNYCYFYFDLLKAPIQDNKSLGSHITYGKHGDGNYYLHNTEYILTNGNIGKKRVCWYKITKDDNLQAQTCTSENVVRLWNTVMCDSVTQSGGVTTPPKRGRSPPQQNVPNAPLKRARFGDDIFVFETHTLTHGMSFEQFFENYVYPEEAEDGGVFMWTDGSGNVFIIKNAF